MTTPRAVKLSEIEIGQLKRLMNGEDIRSSDRPTDKARQKLKRLRCIAYDKGIARWCILDAGRAALRSREGE